MLCCLHRKAKKKEFSKWFPRVHGLRLLGKKVSSASAWAVALGEEDVFPECLGCGARRRGCLLRVLHSGKIFFFFLNKEMVPAATNGVNSSPSTRMALEKAFPEYTIFGSRRRRLSREEIPRVLFPECCTRGRLPHNWAFSGKPVLPVVISMGSG